MSELRRKIANDLLSYTTATYLTQMLGIATSLAMRYFLEPAEMGVWSLLDLVLNYGLYSNLGVLAALQTEMPYHLGRKDTAKALEIRNTSLSFTLFCSMLAAAAFIVWAVVSGGRAPAQVRTGVAAVALILVATSIYNFYVTLMWALKDFKLLSRAIVINALLYLLLIVGFASRFGLNGLLGAVFVSVSCAAAYLALHTKMDGLKLELRRGPLTHLLKTSVPLISVGFAYTFFMGLDRILITRWLGLEALGHYSIALLVTAYANIIPKMMSIVLFPNMQESYGESGSRTQISRFVVKPARALAYGLPLLLGGAYLVVPHLVKWVLPKYGPGLESMRIFLLGTFFISMCQPIQTYLTTIYKRWHLLPVIACGVSACLLVSYTLIRRGFGLNGVAFGMSAGFFVYYSVLVFYVFGHFATAKEALSFYAESLGCFLYYLGVILAIDRLLTPFSGGWDAVLQLAALALACAPLLWMLNKRTGAFSMLATAVRKPALVPEAAAVK